VNFKTKWIDILYINYWELRAIEEPELVKRLGQEYVKYCKIDPIFSQVFAQITNKESSSPYILPVQFADPS